MYTNFALACGPTQGTADYLGRVSGVPRHAAIGSASSSHILGIVQGGSLAGKESASVLSMLRSRLQGLGFRRMACRRLVSASSGEMITANSL